MAFFSYLFLLLLAYPESSLEFDTEIHDNGPDLTRLSLATPLREAG